MGGMLNETVAINQSNMIIMSFRRRDVCVRVCVFCFVFRFLRVSVSVHARSRKSPRQQVSHHIAAADERMQTTTTKGRK